MERQDLIKKIAQLPPDRLAEVENFVQSLEHRDLDRRKIDKELADYVANCAGTDADLDETLEAAAVEHLLSEPPYDETR